MPASTVPSRHTSPATLERGRLRRLQIVEAATQLFARKGYRGASLADIAAEVGVTQPGLLHHFSSKDQLLQAVVQHRSDQDHSLIDTIMGEGGIEIFDRLPLLAEHNLARAGLSQLFTILVAENLLAEDPAHDFFAQRYRDLRAGIVVALEVGRARGEIRADADLTSVSIRAVAAMDGIQTQWLLDPDSVDLLDSYRALGAALRRELAT